MSSIRTRDGKRAGLGDSVTVPACQGLTAVIVGIRKGCALLEYTGAWSGNEWLPGDALCLAQRRRGHVTADCCPVTPGMAVHPASGGYAVRGTVRRPGLTEWLTGKVAVEFPGGLVRRFRSTDLYAAEEDLYL